MASPSSKPSIAIAGATGALGSSIAKTLLSDDYSSNYSKMVLLSRKTNEVLEGLKIRGATIVILGDSPSNEYLIAELAGVDVLVNAINSAGAALRDQLVRILPQTGVKLYFPSEFGVDHLLHEFHMREWDGKKTHYALAQKICGPAGIKMCRVLIGVFLEDGFGQWYGFGVGKQDGVYGCEAVGSVDTPVSYTSLDDVGKIITVLATKMRYDELPNSLRVGGSSASMRQVAELIVAKDKEQIGKRLDLKSLDGRQFKEATLSVKSTDPLRYLRFLMGDGSIDYRSKEEGGLGNDNELVNPGGEWFKWTRWQRQVLGSEERK